LNINVAIYLDRNYAVPAAVMVRSMIENAAPGDFISLFALCVELGDEEKRAMEASWPRERIGVRWIDVDWRLYERGFSPVSYLSKAAYARLLIDRCLPSSVERVITIDCDGAVLGDIGELWRLGPGAHCVRAVRDPCVPRLGDDESPFVRGLAGAAAAPYFNSGLMVVDLKEWRRRGVSDRCLDLGERHAGQALYADQSLLNAALRGAWEPLALRWNCSLRHLAIHAYPSLRDRVYPFSEVVQALERPGFRHFLSGHKPWHATPFHPERDVYRHYLEKTAWGTGGDGAPSGRRGRRRAAFVRSRFSLLCYRQAADLRRKLGFQPRPLADLRHLIAALAREQSFRPHQEADAGRA
jgi:lipopolysaccharide biosynthesis glycosyltransferase